MMNKRDTQLTESAIYRVLNNTVADNIKEQFPLKAELTKAEKAGLIAAGKVRFKEEDFTGPNCPWRPYLFDSFEFPQEEEITAFNAGQNAKIEKAQKKARKMAVRLIDRMVVGRITLDEAAAQLEAAVFWEEE